MKYLFPAWLYCIASLLTISNCQSQKQSSTGMESDEQIIAFGSCNKPSVDGDMWPAIGENNPDIFVWLGDFIYGDTHDMVILKSKYKELTDLPAYKNFVSKTSVIGVWDDHDYGINDGGKYFSKKEERKSIIL